MRAQAAAGDQLELPLAEALVGVGAPEGAPGGFACTSAVRRDAEDGAPGRPARIPSGGASGQGTLSRVPNKPKREGVSVADLLEVLCVGRTTLYRYVSEGLLPEPEGHDIIAHVGRKSRWGPEALARAKKIRRMMDQGYKLEAIKAKLADEE